MLLLGVADVAASKRFYVERGLAVAKSFGRKYVEFATRVGSVTLALYGRRALAKDAGVAPDGTGSHRLIDRQRRRAVHRPGRVRVGRRVGPLRDDAQRSMPTALLVALGGVAGVLARYGLTVWVQSIWTVVAINLVGSFLLGLLTTAGGHCLQRRPHRARRRGPRRVHHALDAHRPDRPGGRRRSPGHGGRCTSRSAPSADSRAPGWATRSGRVLA